MKVEAVLPEVDDKDKDVVVFMSQEDRPIKPMTSNPYETDKPDEQINKKEGFAAKIEEFKKKLSD